jgi:1-acyl-sn-glycerol-3-phosphate acyltransferase
MDFLKNILGRILAVWALLAFSLSLLLFLIPVWLTGYGTEPQKTARVFKVFRLWMKSFFVLSGVRRIITGKENFEEGANYVIVFNHRSFMDVPLSTVGVPGANKTIAKVEMARIPIFGIIYRRGSVLVNRKSEESRRNSYIRMREVLSMGMHMCIYPEGTRNKTKEPLTRFHDGAFKLAVETGKDIIPTLLFGTNEVMPTHKGFFFWPRPVEMHFLPPVPVAGKSVQEVKEEVFNIMKEGIENRYQ